jgi:threonylcarbamoyladenosine tRNA methylthiotransferase MtaB
MNIARKKVAFHTLGCKLNFAETSTISRLFPEDRFEKVPANTQADIYIINTCSVTDAADKKCRQAIKKFIHLSPDAFIAVVGCYAQLNPEEISAIKGVDLVLGTKEKFDIIKYIDDLEKKRNATVATFDITGVEQFSPSFSFGDRTRSFMKIQDGCDYGCSYCTIPLARGKSRNPSIETLVREAELIAGKGIKEIILTGVNIGDFGKSTGDSFRSLLEELVKVNGIERYRISSIEPNLISDDIIEMAGEGSKIMPHFHIPLQSGSDKILGLMRRRYTVRVFADRIRQIRKIIPDAGIGADVIVGFPGETSSDFEDTFSFLNEMPLSYLHVFTFSERPGTMAEKLPGKITQHEKEYRSKKLITLSSEKNRDFKNLNTGKQAEVLFESRRIKGMITGFTGNYLKVELPWKNNLPGKVYRVTLTGISGTGNMTAELIY